MNKAQLNTIVEEGLKLGKMFAQKVTLEAKGEMIFFVIGKGKIPFSIDEKGCITYIGDIRP